MAITYRAGDLCILPSNNWYNLMILHSIEEKGHSVLIRGFYIYMRLDGDIDVNPDKYKARRTRYTLKRNPYIPVTLDYCSDFTKTNYPILIKELERLGRINTNLTFVI